jgi:serine/threonine-protein kinase
MTPLKFLGTDGRGLPRIDRYELVAEIASGGMATVFLGRVSGVGGFQRFFAIKRLHPHLGNDEEFVRMFLDEARIVAGIRHQHVVTVLEVGASTAGYYLVMDYVEGDTLGSLIRQTMHARTPMPVPVAIRVTLDNLAGLHAAHEHVDPAGVPVGLVHRDVSPQNILIDVNGVSRISDFGVAHATSRLGSTRAGQLKGKVAYMAPEQAQGGVVTRRADVFASGIVLWEILCRRRLFLAENEAVTLNRLMFEPIPNIRQIDPELPDGVEVVVQRALQRNPMARFGSAAEMADALQTAARASSVLGTTVDVKTFLERTIGAAIEQRRVAVREHVARFGAAVSASDARAVRPDLSLVQPPSGSSVSAAAMAVPASGGLFSEPGASSVPSQVSSVSTYAGVPAGAPRSTVTMLVVIAAAFAVALVVVVAMWVGFGSRSTIASPVATVPIMSTAPVPSATPAPTAIEAVASAAPATSTDAAPSTSADVLPSATLTPSRTPPRSTGPKTASPPSNTNTPPAGTSTVIVPPAATDDMRNPYRSP